MSRDAEIHVFSAVTMRLMKIYPCCAEFSRGYELPYRPAHRFRIEVQSMHGRHKFFPRDLIRRSGVRRGMEECPEHPQVCRADLVHCYLLRSSLLKWSNLVGELIIVMAPCLDLGSACSWKNLRTTSDLGSGIVKWKRRVHVVNACGA